MGTDHETFKSRLRGVVAFPITPFDASGRIDSDAIRDNVEVPVEAGIGAVVAAGGTGELFGLTPEEVARVTEITVSAVAGRASVIAGVGFGPRIGSELARKAEESGADAVLVLPPYYAQPDPDGLIRYYATIAAATALPMVVYSRDAAVLDPQLTLRLAQEIPNFVAFKDGRGDVRAFQRIRSHVNAHVERGRVVWLAGLGDDIVGAYFAAGAEGFTSSLAAFWPETALALFTAASSGDFARVRSLEEESVKPIYEFRHRRRGYEVSAIKAAMELLGYCAGPVRPPLAEFTPEESEGLRLLLANLGVPTRSERQGAHAASVELHP